MQKKNKNIQEVFNIKFPEKDVKLSYLPKDNVYLKIPDEFLDKEQGIFEFDKFLRDLAINGGMVLEYDKKLLSFESEKEGIWKKL